MNDRLQVDQDIDHADRKDHIAEQTFVQGLTTHNNKYDFVTLGSFETMYASDLQKPPGANFWDWIKTAQFKI